MPSLRNGACWLGRALYCKKCDWFCPVDKEHRPSSDTKVEEKKYCPMKRHVMSPDGLVVMKDWSNCDEDKCAWWLGGMCALTAIGWFAVNAEKLVPIIYSWRVGE